MGDGVHIVVSLFDLEYYKSAEFIQRPKVRRALTAVSAVGIFGLAVGLALTSPH